jgi:hypothetical protein
MAKNAKVYIGRPRSRLGVEIGVNKQAVFISPDQGELRFRALLARPHPDSPGVLLLEGYAESQRGAVTTRRFCLGQYSKASNQAALRIATEKEKKLLLFMYQVRTSDELLKELSPPYADEYLSLLEAVIREIRRRQRSLKFWVGLDEALQYARDSGRTSILARRAMGALFRYSGNRQRLPYKKAREQGYVVAVELNSVITFLDSPAYFRIPNFGQQSEKFIREWHRSLVGTLPP